MMGIERFVLGALARLFGGVVPEQRLSQAEADRMHREVAPVRRRFYLIAVPVAIALGVGLMLALVGLRAATEAATVGAIVDHRPAMRWLGFGALSGLCVLVGLALAEMRSVPRWCGWTPAQYAGYCMTQWGWHPRNFRVMIVVLVVPLAVLFAGVGWSVGTRVDERGVSFDSYLVLRRQYPYTQVTQVALDSAGRFASITFADANVFRYWPEPGDPDAPVVAKFIAQQAGAGVVSVP